MTTSSPTKNPKPGISPTDFAWIAKVLREESGIVIETGKEYLVETRLIPLARRQGFQSLDQFMAYLRSNPHCGEMVKVIDAMTTNETSFFRDSMFFDCVRDLVLPDLIKRNASTRQLRMWCAASSSGQECYSLLMLLGEKFPELLSWDLEFIASDLSEEMLCRIKTGTYSQLEVNRGLPADLLVKYFKRDGLDWTVRGDLRDKIESQKINLVRSFPALPKFDIVFIRNVLIYFDTPTRGQIFGRIKRQLVPGGYLFVGSMESASVSDPDFQRPPDSRGGCFVYNPGGAS